MSLKQTLSDAVKEAMRAKQTERLTTLRFLQAAIKQREVDERVELDDKDILAIIEKQIKQRKESIAAFEQAGRAVSAAAETAELAILSEFLPEQASDEEIAAEVQAALADLDAQGISGPPAMGKAMAILKEKLTGRADMGKISQLLKAKLMP